ncbi:MAG: nuclear transport factor 2 family protein [Actinomycetia bacterium]|nr:nuclear transport factor 2 family protein [Actinomycetes bacterium]
MRITAYFEACGHGSADNIAAHFTPDAVIYDTNLRPFRGADTIGTMWVKVRSRWGGATWHVDSIVAGPDETQSVAAIEWSMKGSDPGSGREFVFRGSEHYVFRDSLIAEIRQYWTFDPVALDTGLVDYDYGSHG